jgi:hypothetical protein
VRQPLVVVVNGDREDALGMVLADDVIVEDLADLARGRNAVPRLGDRRLVILLDDVHAEFDALIADEHRRTGNELPNLVLALPAEGTVQGILGIAGASFIHSPNFPSGGRTPPIYPIGSRTDNEKKLPQTD